MALIYITGAPGSGKSTIQRALTEQGLECYDIDAPTFGGPHNKASGERVVIPPADQRAANWFDYHEWRIYPNAFIKLQKESRSKDVVICGVAEADTKIIHLFDKILYLKLNDELLKERLLNRTDNDYGKNSSELTEIMRRKHNLDDRYNSSNSVIIDASLTLNRLTEEILSQIHNY